MPVELNVDLARKRLGLRFSLQDPNGAFRTFRMNMPFAQVQRLAVAKDVDKRSHIHIAAEAPPEVFREGDNVELSFQKGDKTWNERKAWYRQTIVDANPRPSEAVTKLPLKDAILDIGRWLHYRLSIHPDVASSLTYSEIFQALEYHNIKAVDRMPPQTLPSYSQIHWEALDYPAPSHDIDPRESSLLDMHQMMSAVALPFNVRYHLEVCISQGVLHECNVTSDFLQRLLQVAEEQAIKLLQKATDNKKRLYRTEDVLNLSRSLNMASKKLPRYCALIRSAIITPTIIIFLTPVPETSNRVLRHFRQFEDRFLRVKFTDERYRGKLMVGDDNTSVEVLTRIKRTLKNGIDIGDRHYDFLAFGSSQFREHGAYFFASTNLVSAADIRTWMGKFDKIRVVAKYCSRLGQCFSTTRAITSSGVRLVRIPDIKRNGFIFTDGVGKISVFLAQMIAQELNLPNASVDYPTVFQFRLAGCKGVLTADPTLKGQDVHIRPSQEKFPSAYEGLEICRVSQFGAAYLNQQIILVLSALGVPDAVFNQKLRGMLHDLETAMTDQGKALELLQRTIDFNQMTLTIASMINDGFMATKDPFMISCLRLWQAWNIKYLKEKARIFVDNGAFVLGCVDETGSLQGHYNERVRIADTSHTEDGLPEVFIQVSDTLKDGKYRVIQGICLVARNPSLHPGDIRVVKAVDKPGLRYLKNCIVFPQTGDRDLPNMCSGGDLDGDDFLVMWDNDLMPREWNYSPMDYSAPKPVESDGPVTVDDMTTFFVNYIKESNLSQIAVRHRCWADRDEDGVKSDRCIRLANLHSMAVDYCKTGVPAKMGPEFRLKDGKPHWAAWGSRTPSKTYHSFKILGQLYDAVERREFRPIWDCPFDKRVLDAFPPEDKLLSGAKEIKELYDAAVRRLMAQHGIGTEFEVWTTFALDHNQDTGDYKFAETLGELVMAIKQQHQELCYEKAGTTAKERRFEILGPFVAAMYRVTAEEVGQALEECAQLKLLSGQHQPVRMMDVKSMPLISFPWIFSRELGQIAKGKKTFGTLLPHSIFPSHGVAPKPQKAAPAPTPHEIEPIQVAGTTNHTVEYGDLLDFSSDESSAGWPSPVEPPSKDVLDDPHQSSRSHLETHTAPSSAGESTETKASVAVENGEDNGTIDTQAQVPITQAASEIDEGMSEVEKMEEIMVNLDLDPALFDAFDAMMQR
ncbi:RdRP-domain-containing protein [Polychaeton citri CBS 116435]|uniref:RNA-dependent RNA polymerase n=1 Tax=Polychaeton citri CBS 116435 TaxID=1314669 RepID=A0A9P4UQM3_9PEZI|nr:RdRP-domain-containing protein [Polychaeton citri CBS 116435]